MSLAVKQNSDLPPKKKKAKIIKCMKRSNIMKYLQAEDSDVGTSRRPNDDETSPPNSKRQKVLSLNLLSILNVVWYFLNELDAFV